MFGSSHTEPEEVRLEPEAKADPIWNPTELRQYNVFDYYHKKVRGDVSAMGGSGRSQTTGKPLSPVATSRFVPLR